MPNHDDYDLIDEGETHAQSRRIGSPLIWLIALLVLAIFGFTVGLAAVRILTRLTAEPTATPVAAANTPASTTVAVEAPDESTPPADGTDETAEVTAEATATETAVPATPTAAPRVCDISVDPSFSDADEVDGLGCASSPPGAVIWAAWEPFERGAMVWRSDTDQAYVFANDGRWFPVTARWNGEPLSPRGEPPPGLYEPQRGFGYVWGVDDAIFDALGWATDEEKGFCAHVQDFDNGFAVQSSGVPSCTAEGLYNHAASADWRPLLLIANRTLRSDSPSSARPTGGQPASNRPIETGNVFARPARNGAAFALRAASLPTFDGNFSEWPNGWQPLDAVVYDADGYTGPADLRGVYQSAWSEEGLILAVRVNDDAYRPGPQGSSMWQGDGLEIHFDRLLADDFADWDVNEDDYQIGVSFGPDFGGIDGYRWLPYAQEAALDLPGAARPLGQGTDYRGYNVELLIPWSAFGLDGQAPSAGDRYGFNLSINDNDGEAPAQQATISLSPSRTTHDDPTEWATLVLTQ